MTSLMERGGSRKTYLTDGGTATGHFDMILIIEETTFATFVCNWVNAESGVITTLPAGLYPGNIVDIEVTTGSVILMKA